MKKLLAFVIAVLAAPAFAQSYPTKPVRLIIAFTPGSSTDIIGRAVAAKLQEVWGQPVIAENRPGAGGTVGSEFALRADPDGYTLLANSSARCPPDSSPVPTDPPRACSRIPDSPAPPRSARSAAEVNAVRTIRRARRPCRRLHEEAPR